MLYGESLRRAGFWHAGGAIGSTGVRASPAAQREPQGSRAALEVGAQAARIYANAQQAAGRPATEAKGPRGAAERQAGGESKPETAAQAARRHRSEHRLREKHLARKIWAVVRVRKHLSRWCERARAAVAKRPAPSSTTSTAAAA